MRVFGYVRVSTEDQTLGAEAQAERLRTEARLRGWGEIEIVEDRCSGSIDPWERPGLSQVLGQLSSPGVEIPPGSFPAREEPHEGILLVAKLDRVARSLIHTMALLDRSKREGWRFIALDLGIDTDTAEGRLMVGIFASIAEWERERIRERTREGLAAAKAKGVRLGAEQRYSDDVAAMCYELLSAGHSKTDAARVLFDAGVTTSTGRMLAGHQVSRLADRAARVKA